MEASTTRTLSRFPMSDSVTILKVVGCKYGIPVIEQEESYTSKASLLDLDAIPVYDENDENDKDTVVFSGQRAKRGMYVSRAGKLINADINGAGNILRKAYPYAFDGVKYGISLRRSFCHCRGTSPA